MLNETSSEYGVHTTQITQWKKQVLDELPQIFARPRSERGKNSAASYHHTECRILVYFGYEHWLFPSPASKDFLMDFGEV